MKTFLNCLWQDTQGQDLVEYALMVGLISVVAVASIGALGTQVSTIFSKVTSTLSVAPL